MTLSWDIQSTTLQYYAGSEISTRIDIVAPVVGNYYLMGIVYTRGIGELYDHLTEHSRFGIAVFEDTNIGIASENSASTWWLEEGEALSISCEFTFDFTDIELVLLLMKVVGSAPSFEIDEEIAHLSVSLNAPGLTIDSMASVMVALMIIMMMQSAFDVLNL